jgi:hypothetical protein
MFLPQSALENIVTNNSEDAGIFLQSGRVIHGLHYDVVGVVFIARLLCRDNRYKAGLLDKQLLAWKDLTAWCQAVDL